MSKPTIDFLIEIGCEEIPSRFLSSLAQSFKDALLSSLTKHRIHHDNNTVSLFYTYRRIAVRINTLQAHQADHHIQVQGPPLSIAKDAQGNWSKAAEGFAKKCGTSMDQFQVKHDSKGRDCLFYESLEKGQLSTTCLPDIITNVIHTLYLPIAMRWGSESQPFIRTLHWICCLCDQTPLPITLWDVTASNQTRGHRFLTNDQTNNIDGAWITVNSPQEYENTLQEHHVIADPCKRKQHITDALQMHSPETDLPALIDEVNGLIENPCALLMSFNDSYLTLPDEILTEVMVKHQKYFPILHHGKITNRCLIIADNVTSHNQETIIDGNQRVIHARFNDALFFWKTDQQRPLESYVSQLKNIVFQKGLGSIHDKIQRLESLTSWINDTLQLNLDPTNLSRATYLCKADLATLMVYEFPSLQGKIGQFYSQTTESKAVSTAIADHYLPLQSKGTPPQSDYAAVLAIADRIDTIVGCYYNNQLPTGSQDPLGLRRSMYGILSILNHCQWHLDITQLINKAYINFAKSGPQNNQDQLLEFFLLRVKNFLIDTGISHDIASALTPYGLSQFLQTCHRAQQLSKLSKTGDHYKQFIDTGVRLSRLAKKATSPVSITPSLFEHDIENTLFQATQNKPPTIQLSHLEPLIPIIIDYFDMVLVMIDNPTLREQRLSLVSHVASWFNDYADFEQLVVS